MTHFQFQVIGQQNCARAGELRIRNQTVSTPVFMPVGTRASVKSVFSDQVGALGPRIILANAYHLLLRPGPALMRSLGGIHEFMQWPHLVLTDSGGYQVMSLAKFCKVTDDGVCFRSHIDGSEHFLSPETSLSVQRDIGSDIHMQLDVCTALPCERHVLVEALEKTIRWAERSKVAFIADNRHVLFGIVQGGVDTELRTLAANRIREIGFDGYAIGGLAVGEKQSARLRAVAASIACLPHSAPRYLMGVGKPLDIVLAVEQGVDMFDCVIPTRAGRHGQAFTHEGTLNLSNARYRDERKPLDILSSFPAARSYSRGYIHHLVKSKEPLAASFLSLQNIAFFHQLMVRIRKAILAKTLPQVIEQIRLWQDGGHPLDG